MDSGIILIVVLIIIGFAITWSNQGQVKEVESYRSDSEKQREFLSKHDNRTSAQVNEERETLVTTIESALVDQPSQLEKIRSIINDWADMKIQTFQNRRSWVRNPDEPQT
ncbi:MAG: hypothetical protein VX600_01310 [Candidatus Neomarinimicrobiota bacterium]|jgi:uncharacterized membrane protein|nr:hypothetical protein [Candidatus Neomarinimicrobiota bacterium]|tara:strand:+ start:318 stop:647 length:330 start_codon:yes stop_codon:yes gene_type:complete